MAAKKILPFGHPVLRQKAQAVTKLNEGLFRLLDEMKETLYAAEGRAGLAAPQIGIAKRVIVMDCGNGLIELINPEILKMTGEQIGPEACLSLPGYTGIVKRAQYVKIKSLTRQGKELLLEGEDFLARCMQHEIEHLDGVLYIDHIQDGLLFKDETKQKADLREILRISQGRSSAE